MLQFPMQRSLIILILLNFTLDALVIKKYSIDYFERERMSLTRGYIESHYGIAARSGAIDPKIIVIHATATDDLNATLQAFKPATLPGSRGDIAHGGSLNVSAHYVVDRDGTVYNLMPDNQMARHVIGLNYSSIGIENIGGVDHKEDLTPAQLEANAALVKRLTDKHEGIEYLIGHYEYRCFEDTPLWLERDPNYRTEKSDPGEHFMTALRTKVPALKSAPCAEP